MLPTANAEDYLWQLQRLLPRGRIWHRGWGSVQAADLLTLMPTWARLHARANELIAEVFPCTTVELLPEWEATLGLPDPCVQPPLSTIQQRTAAVCTKFVARGGASQGYFISLATSLGYDITIETYKPFRVGHSRIGDRLYSAAWAFVWHVNVVQGPAGVVTFFRVGKSTAGEPLATWGSNELECLFEALKPANTVIIWSYDITGD